MKVIITKFASTESNEMKIIIDENIVFANEAFSSLGDVFPVNGRTLSNKDVRDADVLIVRSVTKVNEDLLKDNKIKFVGTATIGTDHIDLEYLRKRNIISVDAKGCNADSVTECFFTALLKIASEENISLGGKTIGVVGVGNIGSRVARIADSFGMKVLINDPPLQRISNHKKFVSIEEILHADIITLHVPLTLDGVDKTFHLLDDNNLKKIKSDAIIINTSRGAVIDNEALLIESKRKGFKLILDVWEGEPSINIELLGKTRIATPHISGYSFEGKVNGTKIIYDALCHHLKSTPNWEPHLPEIVNKEIKLPEGESVEKRFYKLFSTIYNIEKDDGLMRLILKYNINEQPAYFDLMRKKYPIRREFSNYTVEISENDLNIKSVLEDFRFTVKIF